MEITLVAGHWEDRTVGRAGYPGFKAALRFEAGIDRHLAQVILAHALVPVEVFVIARDAGAARIGQMSGQIQELLSRKRKVALAWIRRFVLKWGQRCPFVALLSRYADRYRNTLPN